ncbi:MAG: protein-disulfide reductase DsbD family protein [Planctomycetota bacterium]
MSRRQPLASAIELGYELRSLRSRRPLSPALALSPTLALSPALARLLATVLMLVAAAASSRGRLVAADDPPKLNVFEQLGGVDNFGGLGGAGDKVTFTARIVADNGGPTGKLIVTAEIEPQWHIYSITQAKGGPLPTKLELGGTVKVELLDKQFKPDHPPKKRRVDEYPGIDLEEYEGRVVWTAAVRVNPSGTAGANGAAGEITLKASGLSCRDADSCVPFKQTVAVTLQDFKKAAVGENAATTPTGTDEKNPAVAVDSKPGEAAAAAAAPWAGKPGPYRPKLAHANLTGELQAGTVQPGSTVNLVVRGEPLNQWHIYAYQKKVTGTNSVSMPTLIGLNLPAGWTAAAATADAKPVTKTDVNGALVSYHDRPVEWSVPIKVPADAQPGTISIRGIIGIQTCDDRRCEPPQGVEFRGDLQVVAAGGGGSPATGGAVPLTFAASKYELARRLVEGQVSSAGTSDPAVAVDSKPTTASPGTETGSNSQRKWNVQTVRTEDAETTLASALLFAFLGGICLNFMPCVLPVIGLKIVAFVQQSQGNRRRVFLLNLIYSLGLLSVFMVLAALAVVFKLGWGQQFQSTAFNITLISVVFVFALSMLGIWEIPLPGLAGSSTLADTAQGEGFLGAFAKGVFTTMLATPCTGPLMGSALAWAFKQPAPVVFATFFALGTGMALPYLILGAVPQLLKFLPKPGAWMETFKQVMGFVLLATVVFMLSFIRREMVVPTASLLLGLGVGCWWIGRTSMFAEASQKLVAWLVGGGLAASIALLGFTFLGPSQALLPWQPFDRGQVEQMLTEGKTVMIDFTADWCLNCKTNEVIAYNTKKTLAIVAENAVEVVKADKTHADETGEAVDQFLRDLGHTSVSIPFLVIFPGNGDPPIAFDGPVTQGKITAALQKAGRSKSAE